MKKIIYTLTFTIAVSAALLLNGCVSGTDKTDAARENVKDAKEELKTAEKDSGTAAVKTADAEEWKAFKAESELKIDNNKIRIDELKLKMKSSGTVQDELYKKSIDSLDMKNNELKNRMYKYETGKTDWESFKSEFNHDMEGLGKSLKDFTVINKK
jgi:outer membrane murein-binding lipoprotein Lpp